MSRNSWSTSCARGGDFCVSAMYSTRLISSITWWQNKIFATKKYISIIFHLHLSFSFMGTIKKKFFCSTNFATLINFLRQVLWIISSYLFTYCTTFIQFAYNNPYVIYMTWQWLKITTAGVPLTRAWFNMWKKHTYDFNFTWWKAKMRTKDISLDVSSLCKNQKPLCYSPCLV